MQKSVSLVPLHFYKVRMLEDCISYFFFDSAGSVHGYDYDLIVIGGGSGGLACSKEGKYHWASVCNAHP